MKFKDYLSTIVVLVLLVVTFTGCPPSKQNPLKPVDTCPNLRLDDCKWDNIKHNGHNYFVVQVGEKSASRPHITVIHDPDCPCKGK
ncbi:MAG: hypothetical protein M0R80_25700 [Proteobacteria bacterium]|jgi:hypothetical protein|nr:hypothetical protein [Pseudomonadota bacterium]